MSTPIFFAAAIITTLFFMQVLAMNEPEYLLAWSCYIAAALGCLLIWLRLTAWMWRYLREVLRLAVLVLLFTPTLIEPSEKLFAPAIAIVALDLLKVGDHTASAIWNLQLYALIVFTLYLLWLLLRLFWKSLRAPTTHRASSQATQRAEQLRELQAHKKAQQAPSSRIRRIEPNL